MQNIRALSYGSLAVSLIVLIVKYIAYHVTGSVALYSDALESVVNVITAVAAILAINIAHTPPDAGHPYGHTKAEYLSAVAVGVLIILASLAIIREAYHSVLEPQPIDAPVAGLLISSGATALNVVWSFILIRVGRARRSAALKADGEHLLADVKTSIGVLIGVGLAVVTGVLVLDAVIAALVALHVLWSGYEVLRENAGGLMDAAAPEAEIDAICDVLAEHSALFIETHDLKTRRAGKTIFVEFHLVIDGGVSVQQAHEICDLIEDAIGAAVPGAEVTVHVEPEGNAENKGLIVA